MQMSKCQNVKRQTPNVKMGNVKSEMRNVAFGTWHLAVDTWHFASALRSDTGLTEVNPGCKYKQTSATYAHAPSVHASG